MGRQGSVHASLRRSQELNINAQDLTLLVFTRDNIDRLEPLIASTSWINRRVAIDMASQDGTAQRLDKGGFEVKSIEPMVFVDEIRNEYLSIPTTSWTLILDSDEYLADDAEGLIAQLIATADDMVVGFNIPRHNYFCETKLVGSGWYPDHQLRLFRTNQIAYSAAHHVPPRAIAESARIVTLQAPSCLHIHHNNYPTIEEFIRRQVRYAVTDVYPTSASSFNFDDYMLRAIEQFNIRYEGQEDGQLSYVTGLVMYWDQVIRGLMHWERTGYQGDLLEHVPNEVFLSNEVTKIHIEMARLKEELLSRDSMTIQNIHNQYQSSLSWRATMPLRKMYLMILKALKRERVGRQR